VRESICVEEWKENSSRMHPPQITPVYPSTDNPGLFQFSPRTLPQLLFTDTKHRWDFLVVLANLWHTWKPGEHLQMGAYDIF